MLSTYRKLIQCFTPRERVVGIALAILVLLSGITRTVRAVSEHGTLAPATGGSYTEGIVGQPTMLNPLFATDPADLDVTALVFSPLFDLLADIKQDKSGTTYDLTLKEGLLWDDGAPLTSDDVLFTIRTAQDDEARSPFLKQWQGIIAERVSELRVQLTLPTPYVFFQDSLKRFPIVPRHIFSAVPIRNMRLSRYILEPVGSGPYRYERMERRRDGFITKYILIPNDRYHGTRPYISRFNFAFYETEEALVHDFSLRRVSGYGTAAPADTLSAVLPRTTTDTYSMPRYYAVFMNPVGNAALRDVNVRRAFRTAVDTAALAATVTGARALRSPAAFTDSSLFTNSEYRPDDARAAITKAAVGATEFSFVVPDIPFLVSVARILESSWKSVGFLNVKIVVVDPAVITTEVFASRNYDLLLFGHALDNPEDLFPFWHASERFYPGFNLATYQNSTVDRALEGVRQTDDVSKQLELIKTIHTAFEKDVPAVFLFTLPYTYIHTDTLKGVSFESIAAPNERFKDVNQWHTAQIRVFE